MSVRKMKCNWELLEFRVWFSNGKDHLQFHTVWPELQGFGAFKGSGDCNFRPFFNWLARMKAFSFSCASGKDNDFALGAAQRTAANSPHNLRGQTWAFAKLYLYRRDRSDAISRQLSLGVYLDHPVILHYADQGGSSHIIQFGTKWKALVAGTEQY